MNQTIDGRPIFQSMFTAQLFRTEPPMRQRLQERLDSLRRQYDDAEQLAEMQAVHPEAKPAYLGSNVIALSAARLVEQLRAEIATVESEISAIEATLPNEPEPTPKQRLEYLRGRREFLIREARQWRPLGQPADPALATEQAEVEGEIARLEAEAAARAAEKAAAVEAARLAAAEVEESAAV
jgi:hypothetical protein